MKTVISRKWSLALLTLCLGLAVPGVQAQHVNAGALGTGQLYFQNVSGFVNASGFVITNREITMAQSATPTTSPGLFEVTGLSFTALAATSNALHNSSPFAASLGSFIELRIESVLSGPAGATFSFWDHDATTSPTYSLGVGATGTSLIELSDATLGAGTPGGDPFGHIHGRRYSVDMLGDYQVGFRLIDTSVNGPGGGPIQTPSDLYLLTFHAVPEPSVIALGVLGATAIGFVLRRSRKNVLK
jgi:hypothetical protein